MRDLDNPKICSGKVAARGRRIRTMPIQATLVAPVVPRRLQGRQLFQEVA